MAVQLFLNDFLFVGVVMSFLLVFFFVRSNAADDFGGIGKGGGRYGILLSENPWHEDAGEQTYYRKRSHPHAHTTALDASEFPEVLENSPYGLLRLPPSLETSTHKLESL